MKKTGEGLARALQRLQQDNVVLRAGIIESATYPDGESVAQVAFNNEYGTSSIPPRPFFRQTIRNNKAGWSLSVQNLLKSHDAETALNLLGQHMQGQLVQTINGWSAPPNAPSTIAKKGFNAPLRDTMQMARAINYEVSSDES